MVPVATFANVLTPEKYGMLPMVAADVVERPANLMSAPERVIGQVADMVACFPLSVVCRSVPLSDSVPMYALVVDALTNDEYIVEEEYGEVMRLAAVMLPKLSMVVLAAPPTLSQLAERRVEEA